MNKSKFIIILTGFLDVLGIGLIVPVLPGLVQHFGVNEFMITLGVTAYALFTFLATPILGQLSDIYGRKKVLLLCVLGSALSWFSIASTSIYIFYLLGRIINGITGGNISILQAIITDTAKDDKDRQAQFGMIGAIFGSAFIIGPLISAVILHFGNTMTPILFAAALSIIEFIIIYFRFEETNKDLSTRKINFNTFGVIKKGFTNVKINKYLISLLMLNTGFFLFQSIFSLYIKKIYGLEGSFAGYILSAMGVMMIINQAFLMKSFWLKYFNTNKILIISGIGISICYLLLGIFHNEILFFIFFFATIFFFGPVGPVYQSEIAQHASKNERGEINGILGSAQSIAMMVGPFFGGILLTNNIEVFLFSFGLSVISLHIISTMSKKAIKI